MPAACADRANWSQSKQLLGFGAELGMSLDGAAGLDEVNERMQQIIDAWNAQPEDARRSWMPTDGNAGSRLGKALTAAAADYQPTDRLPPEWRRPEPPRLDDEDGDEAAFPNDSKVSAPLVRSCAFVRKVMELTD